MQKLTNINTNKDLKMRISKDKMSKVIKSFVKNGIPFTYKVTNERQEIFSKVGDYSNKESEFPASELNFIKQVKQQIIKKKLYKKIPNRFKTDKSKEKIKYYTYSKKHKVGTIINNGFEVDMKSAYFEMLNTIGMLSEELYERGKTVSKKSRLAAVGTVAKRTEVFYFDGVKEVQLDDGRSVLTEHIWHYICNKVGKIMNEAARACGNGFVFFWVDAMFIEKKNLETVKRVFRKYGYNFSIDKFKYIQFKEKHIFVKGKGKWVEVDGKRYFSTERVFPYKPKSVTDIFKEKSIIK